MAAAVGSPMPSGGSGEVGLEVPPSAPHNEWTYPTRCATRLQPDGHEAGKNLQYSGSFLRSLSHRNVADPCKKKTCRPVSQLLYLSRSCFRDGSEAHPATVTRCPVSIKGVPLRMQSVLLVSAILAGLALSVGLAVLFLRIAFRLLGRTAAR